MRWMTGLALILLVQSSAWADPIAAPTLIPQTEPAKVTDVAVNGQNLAGYRYLERDGALLFPVVPILTALQERTRYDAERHTLTVGDKEYPVELDPDQHPPSILAEDDVLYVDWRWLQALYPGLRIGMGREGVAFSAVVLQLGPHATPVPAPGDRVERPVATHETYYVNVKDRHHYYHTATCKLLAKDPNLRYEVQDPTTMNFILRQSYGRGHFTPLTPCPLCIRKQAAAPVAKTEAPTRPSPSPSGSPRPLDIDWGR